MVKDAPVLGKILAMVLFALTCFGLLLFLWLAFGGPVPLKPKGYRFQTSFAEAGQLALEADVRITGVPVGKVKTITPDKQTGARTSRSSCDSRYAPLPSDAQGDPAPEDAAGRDLRGAHAGGQQRGADPRGRPAARLAGLRHGRARRDPARVRPQDARGFQDWMQTQAQAIARPRAGPQRRARQPRRRSPRTRRRSWTSSTARRARVSRADRQHRDRVRAR